MISIASSIGVMPSPATASATARPTCSMRVFSSADVKSSYSSFVNSLSSVVVNPFNYSIRRGRRFFSEVTNISDSGTSSSATAILAAATTSLSEEETGEAAAARIGATVRVKVPLKVYHVAKLPEVDLEGMEGVVKDYVRVWKGKHVSANLPYKVVFVVPVEGRPPVKFVAHLKEEEFEYV